MNERNSNGYVTGKQTVNNVISAKNNVKFPDSNEALGVKHPDSLNPDSLNPDSNISTTTVVEVRSDAAGPAEPEAENKKLPSKLSTFLSFISLLLHRRVTEQRHPHPYSFSSIRNNHGIRSNTLGGTGFGRRSACGQLRIVQRQEQPRRAGVRTRRRKKRSFTGYMPRSYAGGGITVQLHWMAATATAGTIGWDVSIERVSDSATDLDSDSFAAAQTVNAVEVNATSGVPSTGSAAFTNGSQMDNVVAGDLFRLRVRRDVATDTAAGDAQLLGIEVRES